MDDLMARAMDALRVIVSGDAKVYWNMTNAQRLEMHDILRDYDARPSGNSQEGWIANIAAPTATPAEAFGKSDLGEAGASGPTETPSVEELERAWTAAIESSQIGGARLETLLELKTLRDKRFTWFGREVELMFAIDRYLEANGIPRVLGPQP